jgi:hypothetical protein
LTVDDAPTGWIKRLLREPLVHFMLIGAALFFVFGLTQETSRKAPNRIVVDPGQVEQLRAQFSRTWLRPPTAEELAGLVNEYVRDEVYYREALAMGLDQSDPQIRRRMRQKLEFILEDLSAEQPPGDEVLREFLRQHSEKFATEPQVSFRQVYLSPSRHADLAADARAVLARLKSGAAPDTLGDPTLMPAEWTQASQFEIARSFGEAFAREVLKLAPGAWSGPILSGLGAHLVLVTERTEGRLPELAEVRREVEVEYLARRRQALRDANYQRLRARYEVVVEGPKIASDVKSKATAAAASQAATR